MPSKCQVVGCDNGLKNATAEYQCFPFPRGKKMRQKWVENIGRTKEFVPKECHRVCARHFKESHFLPDELNVDGKGRVRKRKRLKETAFPTLYMRPGQWLKDFKPLPTDRRYLLLPEKSQDLKTLEAFLEDTSFLGINSKNLI